MGFGDQLDKDQIIKTAFGKEPDSLERGSIESAPFDSVDLDQLTQAGLVWSEVTLIK
jgi:hypothetical protein